EFFVREQEARAYEGEGLIVHPVDNKLTIAQKRRAIFQVAAAKGCEWLFIADDDIKLDVRRDDNNRLFRPMTSEEGVHFLSDHMAICGKRYPLVHPVLRMHADKRKYMYEKNCPALRFVCYHVPTFVKEGVDIAGLGTAFMSDRYAQLFMLSRGYNSIGLAQYCVDDTGTNAKGGCSEYRTPELQSEAAKRLAGAFPDNVSLRVKQGTGAWKDKRLDVTIQWKKFLQDDELPYVPKEEMKEYIAKRRHYDK
ncbi:MAG: hypothetical protein GWN64_07825, partial [Candidatus Thorarchaeota archaeon]|nr:hypothetical protein [Candidatus Thorarchaeota archaeon]